MSTQDAYNAGFFDGEGCIDLNQVKASPGSHQLRIFVGQIDRRPLDTLVESYGGTIICRRHSAPKQPLFMWQPVSTTAELALRAMLPYLVVKRDQAETALAARALLRGRGGPRLTEKELGERAAAYSAFRATK